MDLLIWALFLTIIKNGAMSDELSANSGVKTVSTAPAKTGKMDILNYRKKFPKIFWFFYVLLKNCFHLHWFKAEPEECLVVDCAQDFAIENCPETCSERAALCEAADCSLPDSAKFCPNKCVEDSDQAKGKC